MLLKQQGGGETDKMRESLREFHKDVKTYPSTALNVTLMMQIQLNHTGYQNCIAQSDTA